MALLVIFGRQNAIIANQVQDKIRVGLESCKNLLIKNKEIYIGFKEKFINDKFETPSNFKIDMATKFYIDSQKNYVSYQEALQKKNNIVNNHKAVVCLNDINSWSIYLGPFDSMGIARQTNDDLNLNGEIINASQKKLLLLSAADKACLLINNNSFQVRSCDPSGLINLDGKKYRDTIEFILSESSPLKIIAVNILALNKYLYGVVPLEMPNNWPLEALKAQAIISRTYALKNMKLNRHKDYDLCDGAHCQSYLGTSFESDRVNKIIDMTDNLCVYHNNSLIQATFFSSSGGATEDSENVWFEKVNYLRGKKNPPELREESKTWAYEFTNQQIKNNLSKKNIDLGDIIDIKVLEISPSGRVNKLLISGTSQEKIFSKEDIRTVFRKPTGQILDSRLFTIEPILVPRFGAVGADGGFEYLAKLTGSGFGHGVGLSQYGAKAMAEADTNYLDILSYYYTGIDVK